MTTVPLRTPTRTRAPRAGLAVSVAAALLGAGCRVGPDYERPPAPTSARWRVSGPGVQEDGGAPERWWHVFSDPVLDHLVDSAYQQNLTLQAAGLRVLQAQARRGIAFGSLFPQFQEVDGSYTRSHLSESGQVVGPDRNFDTYRVGLDAAWELDFWGRFRRAVESADADLLATVASYDDVLVSLVGEVAATYVTIRVLEVRLSVARDNVDVQRRSLDIARVRFESGGTSELDVHQATTLLRDTESIIPALEIQRQQALNSLSILLGTPPGDLGDALGASSGIPAAPPTVAVGIPADLLRRRPDIRRAERELAAQCARIGVARADLFPSFQLTGSVGFSAADAADLFQGKSFEAFGGPRFDWPILNYGRLTNAVRVQDAAFQELAAVYGDTVLQAQRDVQDALVGYVQGEEQVERLTESVAAAARAVDLSLIQYREGAADFTRVLTAQQSKFLSDDRLMAARGNVTLSVVALYKALGGGWELRDGNDFVPQEIKEQMRARTNWGDLLDDPEPVAGVTATEQPEHE